VLCLHLLKGTVRPPATVVLHETQPSNPPRVPALENANQVSAGLRYNRGDIGQDSAARPILPGQIRPVDSLVDL
jgi:hypothetical protein